MVVFWIGPSIAKEFRKEVMEEITAAL